MGLTGGVANTDLGELSGKTTLAIADPAHPLAAGMSGTRTVHTAAQVIKWGRPAPAAARVATVAGDATRPTVFGYEAGAAMTSGTAAARRVGFFLHDNSPTALTADGWKLFDAAALWAGPPA
jgi:hypothetical protein